MIFFLSIKLTIIFTVSLKESTEYSFYSAAGTFTDRFFLKISSLSVKSKEPEITNRQFNIYSSPGMINIIPVSST